MNILVTGGAGYVGSTLVPLLLSQGHRVRVLDALLHGGTSLLGAWAQPGFEFRRGDMRDRQAVGKAVAGIDAIVHLAAIVGDPACARQPDVARAVNLDASRSLLEESRTAGVKRFVFASTCSNYGKMADPSTFADETAELRPVSLYAETKVGVERMVLDPSGPGPACRTALRFATVFGVSPRMRFDLTVNEFTMRLMTERKLVVYGEQFWRPYIHVADAARGIASVLAAPESNVAANVFNVGSTEQNYTKRMLVDLALPYAPGATVEYVQKNEDPRDYRVTFAKIHDALGFTVRHSVADGVGEVARLIEGGLIARYDDPSFSN